MKNRLVLFALLCLSLSSWAQEFVTGSVIVQFKPNYNPAEWLIIGAESIRQLSPQINAWEVRYATDEEALKSISSLKENDEVLAVQRNHKLTYRAQPNDSLFSDLWNFDHTASNDPANGTGPYLADIGAIEAWDYSIGGTLPTHGDTLVVCVLDDGVYRDHEDLVNNLWHNYNEIPGNGIDDDSNGYVDDYEGWNTYDSNDDIFNTVSAYGSHGTRVSGMIGASGDNSVGIVGVNWNVKIMMVVADGNEADAIAGYDYPITMRKLYNETNGAEGAFVVATNCSWGVDFGQPADAPIWCALYDTLGHYGILNTAATANNNINVDNVGDLPTACPSDFLISVTNTNWTNTKVTNAGYGLESIDIGAPGEQVLTTTRNGGYFYDSGTSFASPAVAGAIALMYSYACPELENYTKQHPDSMALLLKGGLMHGIDPTADLSAYVKSGGKIYLPKCMENMDALCWEVNGLEDQLDESLITVYPNPASDKVTIESPWNQFDLCIYSLDGKLIHTARSALYSTSINVDTFSPGIYLLEMKGKNATPVVRKLVIE